MQNTSEQYLVNIFKKFQVDLEPVKITPYIFGHLHQTYECTVGSNESYALQKINDYIFKDVTALMNNLFEVTGHLQKEYKEKKSTLTTLEIIRTREEQLFFQDNDSSFWRLTRWIPNCYAIDASRSEEDARKLGEVSGDFLNSLSNLDSKRLKETIPNFQNLFLRYEAFEKALQTDPLKRVLKAEELIIRFISHKEQIKDFTAKMLSQPKRVVHNDLKITNILFDATSDLPKAVLDLDTCMPGSIIYDYGDLVRNTSVTTKEDEPDLLKLQLNQKLKNAVSDAFLSKVRAELTKAELEILNLAPFALSITLGLRFLTDYLNGDKYFHASYDEQNFIRARNQLLLGEEFLKCSH